MLRTSGGRSVAGIAPLDELALVFGLVVVGEDVLAAVRHDARAAQDVAVAIADGDDLHAVGADDRLLDAAAAELFVEDLILGLVPDAIAFLLGVVEEQLGVELE